MKHERITSQNFISQVDKQFQDKPHLNQYARNIDHATITGRVLYENNIPISCNHCIFVDQVTFAKNIFEVDISFYHCYFLKGIVFIDLKKTKNIYFRDCKIRKKFIISGGEIEKITTHSTSIQNLIIGSGHVGVTSINILAIGGEKESYMEGIHVCEGSSIKKMQINKTEIHTASFSGNLAIETEIFNCQINSIYFNNVKNIGIFKFLNCKALRLNQKPSHFISNASNLGKTEFLQFDFSTFDEVNIIASVLIECLFVNTTWSNNITSFIGDQMNGYMKDRIIRKTPIKTIVLKLFNLKPKPDYKENKEQLRNKREVYKQIKYALSQQGDFVNERMFHAMEMNTYYQILKKQCCKNISTKIILKLSSYTSNYGQSLSRPILFLLIINGLLFSCFNYIDGLRFTNFSKENIIDAVSKFLLYLNPLRRNDGLSASLLIIDIISRMISSYAIYNIIRATRRFIK